MDLERDVPETWDVFIEEETSHNQCLLKNLLCETADKILYKINRERSFLGHREKQEKSGESSGFSFKSRKWIHLMTIRYFRKFEPVTILRIEYLCSNHSENGEIKVVDIRYKKLMCCGYGEKKLILSAAESNTFCLAKSYWYHLAREIFSEQILSQGISFYLFARETWLITWIPLIIQKSNSYFLPSFLFNIICFNLTITCI